MRVRTPFAGAFATLLLLAAYTSLSSTTNPPTASPDQPGVPSKINPPLAHFLTLFTLTTAFYWILDATRRRVLHLTLLVCTLGLGVGWEVLRALLFPARGDKDAGGSGSGGGFDFLNILANIVGSLAGLGLCAWYHKRMVERKRLRKYTAVPTGDNENGAGEGVDLELGEGPGLGGGSRVNGDGEGHEEGVTTSGTSGPGEQRAATLEEEVDNWDENAIDAWDEEDDDAGDVGVPVKDAEGGAKKRAD